MARLVQCPNGHSWDMSRNPETSLTCRLCGSMAAEVAPADKADVTVSVSAQDAGRADLSPPEVPGHAILGELGRGGMGVVYKARQAQLNRLVAVKMILAGGHAGLAELERFRAEAATLARLQHPNIVQIHEVGEHEGRPYFALEYCPGGSLKDKLHGTPLPSREAAALVVGLARAVHAAHQKGIVHRDLKPANVLLAEDGTLKITDFGLAKRLDEAGQTHSGAVLGTPSYMAPEQASGLGKQVGRPADVYALGAILYEGLTGRPPFQAPTAMETIFQVVHQEPLAPTRLQPQLPRDLEAVCLKCLHKEPERRYATALDLADDLQRVIEGRPTVARPASVVEMGWRWCRRNKAVAGLSAAVLASVLAGAGVALALAVLAQHQADEAANHAARADEEKNRAGALAKLAERRADEAAQQAARAEKEKQRAQKEETRARRFLYDARMLLAEEAWDHGRMGTLAELLASQAPAPGADDFRGFEWYYWDRLLHRAERTFASWHFPRASIPTIGVRGAVFRPDGQALAAWSRNGVFIWDTTIGGQLLQFDAVGEVLHRVVFSPDGTHLAGAAQGKAMVWSAQNGRQLSQFTAPAGRAFTCVAYRPDGQALAAGNQDGTVTIWAGDDLGAPAQVIKVTKGNISAVAYSPDSTRLAVTAVGHISVRDTADGKVQWARSSPLTHDVAFSPDGRHLAAIATDQTIQVYAAADGQPLTTLVGHTGVVRRLSYHPHNSNEIATASWDRTVRVWDVKAGKTRLVIRGHRDTAEDVAYSPDGRRLLTVGFEAVKLWDAEHGQEPRTLRSKGYGEVLSPDGQVYAFGEGKRVRVVDAGTGQEHCRLEHAGIIQEIVFSADGRRLAVTSGIAGIGSNAKDLTVWDVPGGAKLLVAEGWTRHVTFSPDGRCLAAARTDIKGTSSVRVYDAATGREESLLQGLIGAVDGLALHPDGKHVIVTDGTGIKSWNVPSAAVARELAKPDRDSNAREIAVSHDGRRVAVALLQGPVVVYDWARAQVLLLLKGHTREARGLAFSPDGARFATASADGMIKLWNLTTGQDVLTIQPDGSPFRVSFSGDGRQLRAVIVTRTGPALVLWDTSPDMPAAPPLPKAE